MLLAVVLTLRTSGDQSQNRYERSSIIPRGKLRQVFNYSSSSMDFSMWRIMSKHIRIRRSMVHALGLPFYTVGGVAEVT